MVALATIAFPTTGGAATHGHAIKYMAESDLESLPGAPVGEGPITDPHDLGPALQRAVAVVKRGEPALVDVISQGR